MNNSIIIEIILGALTVMGFIAFCVLIMITIWERFVESQVKRIICHFNNEAWRAQEFTERDLWILNSDFDCENVKCETVCLDCAYAETKWQEYLKEKNMEDIKLTKRERWIKHDFDCLLYMDRECTGDCFNCEHANKAWEKHNET